MAVTNVLSVGVAVNTRVNRTNAGGGQRHTEQPGGQTFRPALAGQQGPCGKGTQSQARKLQLPLPRAVGDATHPSLLGAPTSGHTASRVLAKSEILVIASDFCSIADSRPDS